MARQTTEAKAKKEKGVEEREKETNVRHAKCKREKTLKSAGNVECKLERNIPFLAVNSYPLKSLKFSVIPMNKISRQANLNSN